MSTKRSRSDSGSPTADLLSSEDGSWPVSPASSTAPSLGRFKMHLPDTAAPVAEVMHCSLPPHRDTIAFVSYEDYEVHYRQAHVNRCSQCGKNFPTDRFLTLHIEENHDAIVATRRERGEKTYGCFIEDCERKCSTPQKRRMHLIDKHMFPKTYNFYIVNDGIDKQTSLLRPTKTHRRRLSATPNSPQEGRLRNRQTSVSSSSGARPTPATAQGSDEMEIAELEKSMSALRFVPSSVTRHQGRVGRRS
ncbi:C2H2 type zinc finger domain protein [Aspergillus homomorphus CBS 101889]|uniref:C2H2 type zinc finger domain protein n=1 Tax=Aspergillus homomorphus (strain CBS 101889) TaxID=1450537 RepID=A0A395HQF3_ASPHC|nr:C2H2 type zinc finger domain protein [Aspergillus homomorphus CBS 101889]RAL10047.1 C2H2 type zinc finger domain protein [Aspergillus homomorphus CBS 101889]